ncbi:MAG: septation regulator SpoVG [Oscillospiraceae bacterium]|nr:septation regulator SpoVG [Oscillospiraceae bacterium]
MNLTEIKIRKIIEEADNRLKAVISVTIDNCLAVHDIKVIEGDDRLFVAMPSRKDENGIFRDIVHPIDAEARKEIEDEIINEYKNYLELHKINYEFAGC